MKFSLGNNNKIKNSIIGNKNKIEQKEDILVTIIISIIAGVIGGGILYYLGWN